MKKRRVNCNLTDKQYSVLKKISDNQEISISELLRGIINKWLMTKEAKESRG